MKITIYCLCIVLLCSCGNNKPLQEQQPDKKIQVGYHKTIETIMILRALSDDDYFLHRRADTFKGRPMLYEARKYFADYKDHPAVAETQRILYDTRDIGGIMFQGVLYAEELPGTSITHNITNPYWFEHKIELAEYMQLLGRFYTEANVAGFFEQQHDFYHGAISEARSYINDSVTAVMEDYFGKENAAYHMYILPISIYGWGFSATAPSAEGDIQYGIISPVEDIDWDGYTDGRTTFGFGGAEAKAHYRELVVHEFTHSFITDLLEHEDFKKQIAQYDTLYTHMLDEAMQENGYGDWWGFVNEHLVRLGHIRVAEMYDAAEAAALRKTDVQEYKFVLLPDAEERIKQYEQNRDMYKTIDSFLPVLIDQFGEFSKDMIDERLEVE